MSRFTRVAFAAALMAGGAVPAFAADLPDPIVEAPPPAFGGWYIRGDIGMTNQALKTLDIDLYSLPTIIDHGWIDEGGFSSSPLFDVGVGYQFNDYLRGDLTVQYRGGSDFTATDFVDSTVNGLTTNDYTARKSEWLLMANAYADIGTWNGITPYVGAGIGASRNTISGLRDINPLMSGAGYAGEDPMWNFAWALHAGVGIKATDRLTLDLGYSYVSLGDARTGPVANGDPAFTLPNEGFRFKDITSNDLKLGVRYALN